MAKPAKDKIPVQRLLVPKYILIISFFLKNISTYLASRFAAKLFLTPFRYKLPKREAYMDQNTIQEKIILPHSKKEIRNYSFGDSPEKILLVHGWSGRGTQLSKIAENLVNSGYSTISFDAPAHGKSPGKQSMMLDFIEAIHLLDEKYGPFKAVIGHSLGGMSSLRAIKEGLKTEKLIIIGTANSITHITREFNRNINMNDKVAAAMKSYLDQRFGIDMDEYSGAVSAEKVSVPSLIIHDKQDVDVELSSAYELNDSLTNSELFITEGLGHRRILGNEKVINKVKTYLSV